MLTRIPDWKIDEANATRLAAVTTANAVGFATLNDLNTIAIDLTALKATLTTLDGLAAGATAGDVTAFLAIVTTDLALLITAVNALTTSSTTSATALAAASAPLAPIY